MTPIRVFAFSPYAAAAATTREIVILEACRLRGARVQFVLCDAMFGECDAYTAVAKPGGRPADLCEKCQHSAEERMIESGLAYEWLSKYVTPDEKEEAFQWAQNLNFDQIRSASFHGYPIAEWAQTSVAAQFREFPIKFNNWQTLSLYRGFLHALAMTILGLTRFLDTWRPDAIVVINGHRSVLRAALSLARERGGVRALVHEAPKRLGTFSFVENETILNGAPFLKFWHEWADVPLAQGELVSASRWIREKRLGTNQYLVFASRPVGSAAVKGILTACRGRKMILVLTSSSDELVADPQLSLPFTSQEEWIEAIIAEISHRADCYLVIRAHPHIAGKGQDGVPCRSELQWYKDLAARVPPNVTVVQPGDTMSSYDLMDQAELGLTYGSTSGLEMLALGKRIAVVPGFSIYEDLPCVIRIQKSAQVKEALDSLDDPYDATELQRWAFRCIWRYFFQYNLTFPLVSSDCRAKYKSADALSPGADRTLDRLCGFLLKGMPIFQGPSEADLAVSRGAEDYFLGGLGPKLLTPPLDERLVALLFGAKAIIVRKAKQLRPLFRLVTPRSVREILRPVLTWIEHVHF